MNRLLILSLLILTSGCTSFRSTILQRCTNDQFVPNWPKRNTAGIPVKLKVPTHVEVVINEEYFVQAIPVDVEGAPTSDATKKVKMMYREIPVRLDGHTINPRSVETTTIYTDKVFTVDFKRPIAGTLDLSGENGGIGFDDEQYFKTIAATYQEKTIQDITSAIQTLTPSAPGGSNNAAGSSNEPGKVAAKLITDKREVARARFDISSECWEEEMHAFVAKHVTDCQNPCSYLP